MGSAIPVERRGSWVSRYPVWWVQRYHPTTRIGGSSDTAPNLTLVGVAIPVLPHVWLAEAEDGEHERRPFIRFLQQTTAVDSSVTQGAESLC